MSRTANVAMFELMRTAMRIKGRAVERLGSLLEELEKDRGGRPKTACDAASSLSPRQQAQAEAGISPNQAARAQAVARFAKQEPERFEKMVEGHKPARSLRAAVEPVGSRVPVGSALPAGNNGVASRRNRGYDCRMSSMPAAPLSEPPVSLRREGTAPRVASNAPKPKSRTERFEEAHAWVLEHHARTFEKLAK